MKHVDTASQGRTLQALTYTYDLVVGGDLSIASDLWNDRNIDRGAAGRSAVKDPLSSRRSQSEEARTEPAGPGHEAASPMGDTSPNDKSFWDRFWEGLVNARLEVPVALVDTEMVPVVYEAFDKLVRDIEPQDVDGYRIVDATGEVFRVRIERRAAPSFWDRLASFLGAPARYEFERSSDALPPDVVEDAKKALTRGSARG